MRLALFDLDHTLLDGDSDSLWFRFLSEHGAVDADELAEERARHSSDYRAGRMDVAAFYRLVLKPLAVHATEQLQDWREHFVRERILPRIATVTRSLLQQHRDAGHTLLIVTATNRFITEPIARELGVPHLLATELEHDGNRFTGRVSGVPCFREGKLSHLHEWLYQENVTPTETWFYSDSQNDLPLLEYVDHPVAVNPDAVLTELASQRGWPVMQLRCAHD
ncbi:MAG TPA: HAD family hydrolase [Gammaproteobacteria bacterium]|nr:HAD family hydrolase [Gammaproteobacteria bacterium]